MENNNNIEHELLETRLQYEKLKLIHEKAFLKKHFALIITSIISLSAIILSLIQIYFTNLQQEKELHLIEVQKQKELQLIELENERSWSISLSNFIIEHQSLIFSKDSQKQQQIIDILISTYPNEIVDYMFGQFEMSSSLNQKEVWQNARLLLDSRINPKILFHVGVSSSLTIDSLTHFISEFKNKGFLVPPHEILSYDIPKNEIRYFTNSDYSVALSIQRYFRDKQIDFTPADYSFYVKSSFDSYKNYIEIWFK